ncbi:MAG: hypothetical protein JWM57_2313 [Phycisphaerales bacterium]|nr:hypothetical protein [Phycisphaerales bacterium]
MPLDLPPQPFHQLALTPPMGWNSWDCYGTAVTEAHTKANADYMAAHLKAIGYEYIVVDIQWYEPNAKGHDYVKGASLTLDPNGRLLPAENKFPSAGGGSGFRPLADYVHAKGLKFGIHLMRGIPRQAVKENSPILGTSYVASDIADTKSICAWNPDMYGVDMSKPGAQAYYDSVFKLIASWGVDFVKVDDLSRPYAEHRPEIEAIRKAIDASGRPMVLSTSPGETPVAEAEHVAAHANMWRISDDFWDHWPALLAQFKRCADWAKVTGPGHWPDADMLPVGAVRIGQKGPWTHFTQDEQYTLITLWSMARSPLMIGGDLPKNDPFTLALLTNPEVIAVDQHSKNGRQVFREGPKIIWMADAPQEGANYVALFNTGDAKTAAMMSIDLAALGLPRRVRVRDLWKRQDLNPAEGQVQAAVPPHGALLLQLTRD